MKILDYYLNQQANILWKTKYLSTSEKQSGRTFSYYNTNYRNISSFFTQMERFEKKNGLQRSEWKSKMPSGQEQDKHRITNMINANFLTEELNGYFFTAEGLTVLDLLHNEKIGNNEKWMLLLYMLLPFGDENRPFSIISTVKDIFEALNYIGYSDDDILKMIRDSFKHCSKKTLFTKDIFWLVSFYKDSTFTKIFKDSNDLEKRELFNYVLKKTEYDDGSDLIAHKFVGGGVYSAPSFIDDLKVIYFVKIAISIDKPKKELTYVDLVNVLFKEYKILYHSDNDICFKFIKNNKSIFKKCFDEIKEVI